MSAKYSIGLDYGTNSVRTVIVNTANGREVATAVWNYSQGAQGVILSRDPNLARQHPAEYVAGAEGSIKKALALAKRTVKGFQPDQVIGIGVDTTGSTPIPVDRNGRPLALNRRFAKNPAAMAWLWKDHTGVEEAAEITELARNLRPENLASAVAPIPANGFLARFCIASGRVRTFLKRHTPGWNAPTGYLRCSP